MKQDKDKQPELTTDTSDTDLFVYGENEDAKKDKTNISSKQPDRQVIYTCFMGNCNQIFGRKDALDRHEYTHTALKKHSCCVPGCNKAYITLTHLRRHNRTTHGKRIASQSIPKITCQDDKCPKLFSHRSNMLKHFKVTHLGLFNVKCNICDETFSRKAHLKAHMYKHTNEYPYKCDHCQKGFLNVRLFRHHSVIHKSYKCLECPETFPKWSKLLAHRKKEHVPRCDLCQKTFSTEYIKKQHMNTHENYRKVFECPVENCKKFFCQTNNLQTHMRIHHTQNLRFQCDYCKNTLSTKQKLIQHMQKIHQNGLLKTKPSLKRKRIKNTHRAEQRYFGNQKLSTAAILTGLKTTPTIEKLVINGEGESISLIYPTSESEIDETISSITAKL